MDSSEHAEEKILSRTYVGGSVGCHSLQASLPLRVLSAEILSAGLMNTA